MLHYKNQRVPHDELFGVMRELNEQVYPLAEQLLKRQKQTAEAK